MTVVRIVQVFSVWFASGLVIVSSVSAWKAYQFRRFVRQPHPPIVRRMRWEPPE